MNFGLNLGCRIVTNGALLRSCVKVHEVIKLPFGMVTGEWGQLKGAYIRWGLHLARGGGGFGGFSPIGLNGVLSVFLKQKCTRLKREKLMVF